MEEKYTERCFGVSAIRFNTETLKHCPGLPDLQIRDRIGFQRMLMKRP